MGEGSWARLTIGGPASSQALADAVETQVRCRLDECLEDDRVVVEDPNAAWGGFSELEAWLEARGIPFDLKSAACPGAWPDMLVHFRPGRGRLEFASDDSHAEPVIRRSEVAAALRRCRTVRGVGRWLGRTYLRVTPLPLIRWSQAVGRPAWMRTVSGGSRAPEPALVAAWATPSHHGAAVYETLLHADGRLSCNCPHGVFYVRKGRPRGCRHTRAVESQVADRLAGRGTVVGGGSPRPASRPPTATSALTGRPLRRSDVS